MKMKKGKKNSRPEMIIDDSFSEISELHEWLLSCKKQFRFRYKPKKEHRYFDCPMGFDIESTSFRNYENEKRATMYIWQISIFGKAFYGRTWAEFRFCYNDIVSTLETDLTHRAIIYIHFLSFEFGFIENLFEWQEVFCSDLRKPIFALTKDGIEFRCSFMLTGASLSYLGEHLQMFHVQKMEGDLDYSLPRHNKTPLTDKEMLYCLNDVQVLVAHIEECIRSEKLGIAGIPLTKTGYPRRLMKKAVLYGKKSWDNRRLLEQLTFDEEEFRMLIWSFTGGFTHTNHNIVGKLLYFIASYDFTSSYPYCLLLPLYPISKGRSVVVRNDEHFNKLLQNYCCLIWVKLTNVKPKVDFEHILSYSKTKRCVNAVCDNGRIVTCDSCEICITETDYKMLREFYDFDKEILKCYVYRKGYLPRDFIATILDLFWKKQTFKGVPGKEAELMRSKSDLNAMYGVCVTSPVKTSFTFDGEWKPKPVVFTEALEKYNTSKNRFISYAWGVWCTSIARSNLQRAILYLKDDYCYSDTDSVKYRNYNKHEAFFKAYNDQVEQNIRKMCDFYKFEYDEIMPKGKIIGVFDYEGQYTKAKFLGAKRYMVEKEGKITFTVSGLNKKVCMPWMIENYALIGSDPFEQFEEEMIVPEAHTGKNTHTYCDSGFIDYLEDYLGNTSVVQEYSFVHLEETGYSLSFSEDFRKYLGRFKGD